MRRVQILWMLFASVLLVAESANAQTPIIIGPATVLAWDVVAGSVAEATAISYAMVLDGAAPVTLTGVTCVANPSPSTVQTCSVLASTIPMGSHSITLTSSISGITSLPSAPFAYLDLVIPIPSNIRFK